MDRRQVHDVKTQIAKLGQPALRIVEASRLTRLGSLGSHKHLVPGSEASLLAIDDQFQKRFESRHAKPFPDADGGGGNLRIVDRRERGRSVFRLSQPREGALEQFAIGPARVQNHFLDERDSLQYIGRDRPLRSYLLGEVRKPAGKQIGPGFDRKYVALIFGGAELSAPSIVVEWKHRRFVECFVLLAAPFDCRAQYLVPVAKNIRFDNA